MVVIKEICYDNFNNHENYMSLHFTFDEFDELKTVRKANKLSVIITIFYDRNIFTNRCYFDDCSNNRAYRIFLNTFKNMQPFYDKYESKFLETSEIFLEKHRGEITMSNLNLL